MYLNLVMLASVFLFGNPPLLQDKRNFVSLADALAWVRAALLVQTLGRAVWCSAKSAKRGFFPLKLFILRWEIASPPFYTFDSELFPAVEMLTSLLVPRSMPSAH